MYLSHKNFLFGKILMTSFHVICGLDLPQSKILGTPINWRSPKKIFLKTFFFFLENTCACVLGPWPWPRAFLSLALRGSVLGKAVLGLERFCPRKGCPWPWPWPRIFFVSLALALASSFVSSTPPLLIISSCRNSKLISVTMQKQYFCCAAY